VQHHDNVTTPPLGSGIDCEGSLKVNQDASLNSAMTGTITCRRVEVHVMGVASAATAHGVGCSMRRLVTAVAM
jgi:hypothetical protein